MGLKDLYSLLHDRKEVPFGVGYTKILKEIQKFKESKNQGKTDKNAIIIIDFQSLVYDSKISTLTDIRGKRWGEVLEKWKTFFDTLIAEDMELLFFHEAYQIRKTTELWLSNKTKAYLEQCEMIQDFEQGEGQFKNMPYKQSLMGFSEFLQQNLKEYGKWTYTVDTDVSLLMASVAKEKKVFAVLTDSYEFLVFEGHYRLWRIRNINFDQMSAKELNKFNLRKALRLYPEHMPLFATLCGSDMLWQNKLQKFHESFPERRRIKEIAKYVTEVKGRNEEVDLEKVSKRIGCSKEEIEASLERYSLQINQESEEDNFLQKLRLNNTSKVYDILRMEPRRIRPYFEDLRSQILNVHQMDLSLWLLRCQIGIIFKEKNDLTLKYPFYTIKNHEKGYELFEEFPEYPPFDDLPNLEELMFGHETPELMSIRFDLLKWALKFDELDGLTDIPDNLVPVVLTLKFMTKEAQMETMYADMFLLTFNDTMLDRVPIIPETDVKPEIFPFQLSFYYLRMQNLVIRLLSTVGFEKWAKYEEFNGIYFHHLYNLWKNLDDYAKIDRLNEIQHMRLYAKQE